MLFCSLLVRCMVPFKHLLPSIFIMSCENISVITMLIVGTLEYTLTDDDSSFHIRSLLIYLSKQCNFDVWKKFHCHWRQYHQLRPTEIHVYAVDIIANKCGRLKGVIWFSHRYCNQKSIFEDVNVPLPSRYWSTAWFAIITAGITMFILEQD